jgi:hypothetical protein
MGSDIGVGERGSLSYSAGTWETCLWRRTFSVPLVDVISEHVSSWLVRWAAVLNLLHCVLSITGQNLRVVLVQVNMPCLD